MDKYEKQHQRNLSACSRQVDAIYRQAVKEAAQIGVSIGELTDDEILSFDKLPRTKKAVNAMLTELAQNLSVCIVNGVQSAWTLANNKDSELCDQVLGDVKDLLNERQRKRYYSNNDDALEAFLQRKEEGLNLSERVWRYASDFKTEIELGLDCGIRDGVAAETMQRSLQQYLQHPDMLFRRVRDIHGNLQLSKRAKAYHPGAGVYRSSYKNARRLAVTETNIAYRTADYLRWQDLDFVVGIRVVLSNNHPVADICNELSAPMESKELKGRGCYPKDFKFTGWHPHCRCHSESILKTHEELQEDNRRIMRGEEPSGESVNKVTSMPKEFTQWVEKNQKRIARAKSLPYFLKDNKKIIERAVAPMGTKATSELSSIEQLAKSVGVKIGEPMTHEQADMKHPNPHYGKGEEYRVNCQSCVVAYELRRRGLPVEAFGKITGSMGEKLSHSTQSAWLDADGNIPTPIICKQEVKSRTIDRRGYVRRVYTTVDDVWKDILSKTTDAGRYHLSWYWEGKDCGHIITMETLKDGTRRFYDPQTGLEAKNILPWIRCKNKVTFDLKKGIRAYRVDTLQPNPLIAKGVIKKANSTGVTPKITAEQRAWWRKNIEDKKDWNLDGTIEPLSPKDVNKSYSNGKISVHETRICNANKNKQERAKFLKEHRMCDILAQNGHNVEMLEEIAGVSSPDILIDGLKADLKATKGTGNIVKYAKKAVYGQHADMVIFEFEEITEQAHQEINKLKDMNIHGIYFAKGKTETEKF